jgi:hypothetical protein
VAASAKLAPKHCPLLLDPMSDVQQDRRDSPDEKPPAPYPSHGAIAAPQRRPRVRTLIVRGLALAAISAAVGAAVALLALPLGINRQLAAPPYAKTQSTVNPSVEQVASKVLPSVVTMTTELGGGELHCLSIRSVTAPTCQFEVRRRGRGSISLSPLSRRSPPRCCQAW